MMKLQAAMDQSTVAGRQNYMRKNVPDNIVNTLKTDILTQLYFFMSSSHERFK
jgi:hypothetical protein